MARILFRNYIPVPASHSMLPKFSPRSFRTSSFVLRPLIHLGFVFVQSERQSSSFISNSRHAVYLTPFVEDNVYSTLYTLLICNNN